MKKMQKRRSNALPTSSRLFIEHVHELRSRLLIWFFSFAIASGFGYAYHKKIVELLVLPLDKPLFYSSPIGGFEAVLRISFFSGFVGSLPILIYQIISFIEPAFTHYSRRTIITITVLSFLLALIGIVFAHQIVVPISLRLLESFGAGQLQPLIATNEYFSYLLKYLFSFSLLFQLPLVLIIIHKYHAFKLASLLLFSRTVIVFSFICSAILTPTGDFVNQAIMAFPIIALYFLSVFVIWMYEMKNTLAQRISMI